MLSATQDLIVDRVSVGVNLVLSEPPSITGNAWREPSAMGELNVAAIGLVALLTNGNGEAFVSAGSRIAADGRFQFDRLEPGRYLVRATNVPSGWILHSITKDGEDYTDRGITVL